MTADYCLKCKQVRGREAGMCPEPPDIGYHQWASQYDPTIEPLPDTPELMTCRTCGHHHSTGGEALACDAATAAAEARFRADLMKWTDLANEADGLRMDAEAERDRLRARVKELEDAIRDDMNPTPRERRALEASEKRHE